MARLLASWLCRRTCRRLAPIIMVVVLLTGAVHYGFHFHRDGQTIGTGVKDAVDGRCHQALHAKQASRDGNRIMSPCSRTQLGPVPKGLSSFKESMPHEESAIKEGCVNTHGIISKSRCSKTKHTDWEADARDVIPLEKPGHQNSTDKRLRRKPQKPFPWPIRENLMKNHFLNYNRSYSGLSSSDSKGGDLVFLHHNKAAGTSAKECLRKVVNATDRELGHVLSNAGRLGLMSNLRKLIRRGKRIPDTYFGGYAFGVCDELRRPCSYFTVLRDPYKRTLSSHSYCKTARTDQLCTALHAEKVTLREWAIHQGSFFFRQLVFNPIFCSDRTKWIPFVDLKGEPHEFDGPEDSLEDATCWFRQKLIMSLTLNQTEQDALLRYSLDNLANWFKVIMLVDEFDLSLAMMEEAYKLPFHSLCSGHHVNIGSYDQDRNVSSTDRNFENPSVKEQLRQLREDPDVRAALHADLMIYQKGLDIFERQRQVFAKMKSNNRI